MVPVSYETLKSSGDVEPFSIWDKDGNEYQGEFTQFRVSGDSIPEGYHLYGMRHGDNDMIQHPDIEQTKRLSEQMGQCFVCLTRFDGSGRMIVRENDTGCIARQCGLDHFTRVHAGMR